MSRLRATEHHSLHEDDSMRRLPPLTVSSTLTALALGACFSGDPGPTESGTPQSATVEASATADRFSPSTVTIARGGTVTWTFGARRHNVTFRTTPGAPANVPSTENSQAARQFPSVGSFGYDCTLHPGMAGTVVVE
jgi:plastocyanin